MSKHYLCGRFTPLIHEDEKGRKRGFSASEWSRVKMEGLPLFDEHEYDRGRVGRFTENWIDGKWCCVRAEFDDTPLGQQGYQDVITGKKPYLSIGMAYDDPMEVEEIRNKIVFEGSLTSKPKFQADTRIVEVRSETGASVPRELAYLSFELQDVKGESVTPLSAPAGEKQASTISNPPPAVPVSSSQTAPVPAPLVAPGPVSTTPTPPAVAAKMSTPASEAPAVPTPTPATSGAAAPPPATAPALPAGNNLLDEAQKKLSETLSRVEAHQAAQEKARAAKQAAKEQAAKQEAAAKQAAPPAPVKTEPPASPPAEKPTQPAKPSDELDYSKLPPALAERLRRAEEMDAKMNAEAERKAMKRVNTLMEANNDVGMWDTKDKEITEEMTKLIKANPTGPLARALFGIATKLKGQPAAAPAAPAPMDESAPPADDGAAGSPAVKDPELRNIPDNFLPGPVRQSQQANEAALKEALSRIAKNYNPNDPISTLLSGDFAAQNHPTNRRGNLVVDTRNSSKSSVEEQFTFSSGMPAHLKKVVLAADKMFETTNFGDYKTLRKKLKTEAPADY